jgi:hypothetical protein
MKQHTTMQFVVESEPHSGRHSILSDIIPFVLWVEVPSEERCPNGKNTYSAVVPQTLRSCDGNHQITLAGATDGLHPGVCECMGHLIE